MLRKRLPSVGNRPSRPSARHQPLSPPTPHPAERSEDTPNETDEERPSEDEFEDHVPFTGSIKYVYPVEPPLDPGSPDWLKDMNKQLRKDRKSINSHKWMTQMFVVDAAKDMRLAELELKRERKISRAVYKLIGNLAGPRYLEWVNQFRAAGQGELSAESDEDIYDWQADEDDDDGDGEYCYPGFPGPPVREKRTREDDVDDRGEEGNDIGPRVRNEYKRRRLLLKDKLKDVPLYGLTTLSEVQPTEDQLRMHALWGLKASEARAVLEQEAVKSSLAAEDGSREALRSSVAHAGVDYDAGSRANNNAPVEGWEDDADWYGIDWERDHLHESQLAENPSERLENEPAHPPS